MPPEEACSTGSSCSPHPPARQPVAYPPAYLSSTEQHKGIISRRRSVPVTMTAVNQLLTPLSLHHLHQRGDSSNSSTSSNSHSN